MDKIFDGYLADVHDAVPFGRAFSFAIACLLFSLAHAELRLGALRELLLIGPGNFVERIWSTLMIGDALVAVIVVWGGAQMADMAIHFIVEPIWSRLDATKRMERVIAQHRNGPVVGDVQAIQTSRRQRLRSVSRLHQGAEVAFTIGLSLLILFAYTGREDLAFAALSLTLGLACVLLATMRYLRWVVPFDIHLAAQSGSGAPKAPDLKGHGD